LAHWPQKKPLDFGGNLDLDPGSGFFKLNFYHFETQPYFGWASYD